MKQNISGIPELLKIRGILNNLPDRRTEGESVSTYHGGPSVRGPWGGQSLSSMFRRVNWQNEARNASFFESPSESVRQPRGTLSTRTFLGLVNWSNAKTLPHWPMHEGAATAIGLQSSVESILSGFGWGESSANH